MTTRTTNPMTRLAALLVAFSLSVCCCNVHTAFGAFVDAGADVASCCCDSTDQHDGESECPDPADAPTSCKDCCIKGTGLESHVPSLPTDSSVTAVLPEPTDWFLTASGSTDVMSRRTEALGVPRSLWHLHCALLI